MSSLTMRFIGRSSKLLGDIEGTKRYKKEVYFDEKVDIFGHAEFPITQSTTNLDGSNTHLRVGETLYPFTFPLPPGLPSSFEWPDGNVLYFVEAKLTRASWKDKRVSSRLQVEGVYDLNLEPGVLNPVEIKRQKYVKHLLSKSGPYGFTFKCSRSGFVRGHSLPFSVEIRNLSKVDSRKLKVSLLQEVKLGDGKAVATLIEQMKGPKVTSGEVVTWEARLKVPGGIPPTNLGNVLSYPVVIPVLYFIHIQLSLRNCREEPICVKVPVTIGSIPIQRQRALSVPSLDGSSTTPAFTLSSNGHRMDCPMSQLILPSAAITTSQFSPHLVSVNTATSFTHTQLNRGQSLYPNHTISRSNRTPVQILGPVRQYEYYFEYDDSTASNRGATTRGESFFQRRRNQNNLPHTRNGRQIIPFATNYHLVNESPPPSYDEIFTRERLPPEATFSIIHPNANDNSHERIISSNSINNHDELAHRALSAQPSSSTEEDGDDSSSLVLPLSNDNNSSTSSSSSGGSTSCDSDDTSTNDEFASSSSSSGISASASCEELKHCHDLQNDLELRNGNGYMMMRNSICDYEDDDDVQGVKDYLYDDIRSVNTVICGSGSENEDDA
ncbi:Arrestin domain-containing protein 3 [Orchesella cincta]|uniref:Arrestin domain-containing protein 3 n=1 Tax=Orchesella cincta TaxID=48709 RepID=A0A1D2N0F9_ORCCI|nr:Arrestin domain-containing protein 3 [Orchesella cincta]